METDDIKTAVFVVACMAAEGVFGYYAGKHRVEVDPVNARGVAMVPVTNYGHYVPTTNAWMPVQSPVTLSEWNIILSNLVAERQIEARIEEDTNRVALIEFLDAGKPVLFVYPVQK